jgi:hypothetical protein
MFCLDVFLKEKNLKNVDLTEDSEEALNTALVEGKQ